MLIPLCLLLIINNVSNIDSSELKKTKNEEKMLNYRLENAVISSQAIEALPRIKERFLQGLHKNEVLSIFFEYHYPAGGSDLCAMKVLKWEGDMIYGIINIQPEPKNLFKLGEFVTLNKFQVKDWSLYLIIDGDHSKLIDGDFFKRELDEVKKENTNEHIKEYFQKKGQWD